MEDSKRKEIYDSQLYKILCQLPDCEYAVALGFGMEGQSLEYLDNDRRRVSSKTFCSHKNLSQDLIFQVNLVNILKEFNSRSEVNDGEFFILGKTLTFDRKPKSLEYAILSYGFKDSFLQRTTLLVGINLLGELTRSLIDLSETSGVCYTHVSTLVTDKLKALNYPLIDTTS